MRKIGVIAVLAFAFLSGCHDKLEILAPYRESVSVYGMLDQDDTAQYIRVQRVFLGEGNALVMAQNPDSAYYKPGELKVSLQRIKNGVPVSVDVPATSAMEIVLSETYVQLEPGVFSTNQLIYKTKHPIYEDSQYRLVIHNNKTGADFSSKNVSLVGDFSSKLTYGQQQSVLTLSYAFINIVPSFGGTVVCKYGSPANSGVCGLKCRFYYTEYPLSSAAEAKSVDIDLGYSYTSSSGGGETVDLTYSGDAMLLALTSAIGENANVGHRTADSVRYYLNGAGTDLAIYNEVASTSTLSQDKPVYTNINGGIGIFSSRRDYYIRKRLSAQCVDRIASDKISCGLRFYGSAGGFLPCQ
jgi:hypothetical protein